MRSMSILRLTSLFARPPSFLPRAVRPIAVGALAVLIAGAATGPAFAQQAHAWLVFDARTGEVIERENADQAWYPASVTKLMTTYVAFQAVKAGRMKMSSPVTISAAALANPPSKMGFPVGSVLTLDNALKIIMVKSANDVAHAIGESISGSRDAFVDEMNAHARRLGMTRTVWGNPHGLPDPGQYTTARDLGILARALIREFPEYASYFKLPALQLGKRIIRNHNHLVDRFPGTDGMKTGFICSSGFNVVASVTRNGRRLVAVVLGSPNARNRAEKAAELFTKAYAAGPGFSLFGGGSKETIEAMRPDADAGRPPMDIRSEVCGRNRKSVGEDAEDIVAAAPLPGSSEESGGVILGGILPQAAGQPRASRAGGVSYLTARFETMPPVKIWLGGADAAPPVTPGGMAVAAAPVPSQVTALVPEAQTRSPGPGAIFAGAPKSQPVAVPVLDPKDQTATARAFSLFSNTPTAGMPQAATGPAAGAGVADSLPPANGAPMVIAATPPANAAPPAPPRVALPGAGPAAEAPGIPVPRAKPAAARVANARDKLHDRPRPAAAKPGPAATRKVEAAAPVRKKTQ